MYQLPRYQLPGTWFKGRSGRMSGISESTSVSRYTAAKLWCTGPPRHVVLTCSSLFPCKSAQPATSFCQFDSYSSYWLAVLLAAGVLALGHKSESITNCCISPIYYSKMYSRLNPSSLAPKTWVRSRVLLYVDYIQHVMTRSGVCPNQRACQLLSTKSAEKLGGSLQRAPIGYTAIPRTSQLSRISLLLASKLRASLPALPRFSGPFCHMSKD